MKKMNKNCKLISIFTLGIAMLLASSCESDVDDLNTSPNQFTEIDPSYQIGTAQLATVLLLSSDGSRYSSLYANHTSGSGAQFANAQLYNFAATDFDNVWQNAYQQGLNQSRGVKENALAQGLTDVAGLAMVNEAIQLGELAAMFGDVPNTEAVTDIDNPKYDSQASVLQYVQTTLSEALPYLTGKSGSYLAQGYTSTSSWDQIIHSLKARYYLIQKDYTNALAESQQGISSRAGDVNSIHTATFGARNIWYQFGVDQRPDNIIGTGSYLYDLLDTSNTTVNRQLATPGDAKRFAYYYNAGSINHTSTGVFYSTSSFPIISFYETKLIEAEAAYRMGNEATALTALNAVRAELAVQFNDSFPNSAASGAALLKDILEEKYITLFCQTQVAHDLARTANFIGVTPKIGAQIPYRFLYPQTELSGNTNVPNPRPSIFDQTPVNQ